MAEHILYRKQILNLSRPELFEFFADAGNLERITPPHLNFRIITPQPISIKKGSIIDYKIGLYGIGIKWKTLISTWNPPFEFVDEALQSPYKQWIHQHKFTEIEPRRTLMEDTVRYRLPFEPLGDSAHFFVKRELDYIFDYRLKVIAEIFGQQSS